MQRILLGGGGHHRLQLRPSTLYVAAVCEGQRMPEQEARKTRIVVVDLLGLLGQAYHLRIVALLVVAVDAFVVVVDATVTLQQLLVVLVVAYEVGKIRVGKSHKHHVAVVVGLRRVALPVVDAVEHIESLHDVGRRHIIRRQAVVALQRPRQIAHAVVEDVGSAKQCRRRQTLQ